MRMTIFGPAGLLLVILVAVPLGCGGDNPTKPPVDPTMPAVPVPASPTDLLPEYSPRLTVSISAPLEEFQPKVTRLQMMLDGGTETWRAFNRPAILACPSALPRNTGSDAAANATYISARPRLRHARYWQKLKQVVLDPGTLYSKSETISYGRSSTSTESKSFQTTMGVEVTAGGGWGGFSASVTGYFEQTSTYEQIQSITFDEEKSYTETYSVESAGYTRVYALWQLVDEFSIVDEDTVKIHESATLLHVEMPEIADLRFPNKDMVYQSVTKFD